MYDSQNPIENNIKSRFLHLKSLEDVANILGEKQSRISYYAFIVNPIECYKFFEIQKKTGGSRTIATPTPRLKNIQRKLNQILQEVYLPKASVHGFVRNRSILSNARRHLERVSKRQYVLNIDLEDFFPSITYRRIKGMFQAVPYNLPENVALIIARLCCCDWQLPQGAPTSPVIANMICAKMDTQLLRFAQQHKCIYTRYADDITISTSLKTFPAALAKYNSDTNKPLLGKPLVSIINSNGFSINPRKTRLLSRDVRQEITGLTVNKFPNVPREYVRKVRAMLNAWEKHGYTKAQTVFEEKYCVTNKVRPPQLRDVIRGKIEYLGMIRGRKDPIYLKYHANLELLDPSLYPQQQKNNINSIISTIIIWTEGKTDSKHLRAAFNYFRERGDFSDLNLDIRENQDVGSKRLLKLLTNKAELDPPARPELFIFDRDEQEIIPKVLSEPQNYKKWVENLYSFALPIPSHRKDSPDVCIELYYPDQNLINKKDDKGRRLFLSYEFDSQSGRHKEYREIVCQNIRKYQREGKLKIVDDEVFDGNNMKIALSKDSFASSVLEKKSGFDDMDFTEFRLIFELIQQIITDNKRDFYLD